MRSSPLFAILFFLSGIGLCDLPAPGHPALSYADGSFVEPRGTISSYAEGGTMNISWTTDYATSNLWMIIGYSFNTPVQVTTNTAVNWYQWKITADANNLANTSQVYAFRVVNATGTQAQQAGGGFLSAAFFIKDASAAISSATASKTASKTATSSTLTSTFTGSQTAVAPGSVTTSDTATSSGPSNGTNIGIGVGVGLGGAGLIALGIGFYFWRRSKARNSKAAQELATGDMQQYGGAPGYTQPGGGAYTDQQQQQQQPHNANEYYKPADPYGHNQISELSSSVQSPVELQGNTHEGYGGSQNDAHLHEPFIGNGQRPTHYTELG